MIIYLTYRRTGQGSIIKVPPTYTKKFQADKQKTLRIAFFTVIVREYRINKGSIQCQVCNLTWLDPRVHCNWSCATEVMLKGGGK